MPARTCQMLCLRRWRRAQERGRREIMKGTAGSFQKNIAAVRGPAKPARCILIFQKYVMIVPTRVTVA